jgi:hypothetical protein
MKAIIVKYLPATNTKGSRLKAMAEGVPSIIRGFDHKYNDGGKAQIAQELCNKYGWDGKLVSGQLPNGDNVFCFIE